MFSYFNEIHGTLKIGYLFYLRKGFTVFHSFVFYTFSVLNLTSDCLFNRWVKSIWLAWYILPSVLNYVCILFQTDKSYEILSFNRLSKHKNNENQTLISRSSRVNCLEEIKPRMRQLVYVPQFSIVLHLISALILSIFNSMF